MTFKAVAVGRMKMGLQDFLELTPMEFKQIFDMYEKNLMQHFELQQLANYAGFGQANGGKKFKSVFTTKDNKPVRIVSPEEKEKELADIQQRLKGVE